MRVFVFGLQVVEVLNKVAAELDQRRASAGRNRNLAILAFGCRKIIIRLNDFMNMDSFDPDLLNARINKLIDIYEKLGQLTQIQGIDPDNARALGRRRNEGPQMTRRYLSNEDWVLWAMGEVKTECVALINLRNFYKKNSARIDHGLNKVHGFTKQKYQYAQSKGLVTSKLSEKTEKHLKVELGRMHGTYKKWLRGEGAKYVDKSSAYTATRFLLERENWEGLRQKGIGRHPEVEDMPDNQIRYDNHKAMAVYTIKLAGGSLYAYPGDRRAENFLPTVRPLHTLVGAIPCGDGNVSFLRRMDFLQGVELPQSLKYAMRHDDIFIEIHFEDSRAKHADAVDFKSVQAAGGIVAKEGKIVAIDNVSGHYEPGWGLLAQAVKRINSEDAFRPNAVVGVFSGKIKKPWFFPLRVFLTLAEGDFAAAAVRALRGEARGWPRPGGINDELGSHLATGLWTPKDDQAVEDFAAGLKKIG